MYLIARRLLSLLLVVTCAFVGSACGGGDVPSSSTSTKDVVPTRDNGPSQAELAGTYDAQVAPQLTRLAPLITRASGVMAKADVGQITIDVAAAGFRRQAADVAQLQTTIAAIETPNKRIGEAHSQLNESFAAYVKSMTILGTIRDADSQARFDAKLNSAVTQMEAVVDNLTEWETALADTDKDMAFPKSVAAATAVATAAESFG